MKALLLSHSDGGGGAGRAAFRLHQALRGSGVDSRMQVDVKVSADPDVGHRTGWLAEAARRARVTAELLPGVSANVAEPGLFSPAITSGLRARSIDATSADVVNVHWINMGLLSVAELGRIRKPLVWTLHDMWAFTGGRNYAPDDVDARWRHPLTPANAPSDGSRWDVDRWVWRRKQREWVTPRQLVAPSRWLAELAQGSELLGDWPVRVIPNPLDTESFRPYPRPEARAFHGLPPDVPMVLFALTADLDDPRKGWDLLKGALQHTRLTHPDVELAVMGHAQPPGGWAEDLPRTHWLGRLTEDRALALAYSAADITVVPSRQDNLPQTGTEAQACGCPVVAFRIGGLPDVVDHEVTGYLAGEVTAECLAAALSHVLESADRRDAMASAARQRAVRSWSYGVVGAQYEALFAEAIDACRPTLP